MGGEDFPLSAFPNVDFIMLGMMPSSRSLLWLKSVWLQNRVPRLEPVEHHATARFSPGPGSILSAQIGDWAQSLLILLNLKPPVSSQRAGSRGVLLELVWLGIDGTGLAVALVIWIPRGYLWLEAGKTWALKGGQLGRGKRGG